MATLKDWVKYADDEEEQPVKREKIKKTSIKIKTSHAEDPEWKEDREEKRRAAEKVKADLLKKAPIVAKKIPLVRARSNKIF